MAEVNLWFCGSSLLAQKIVCQEIEVRNDKEERGSLGYFQQGI
jgi:hypothetical protein